MQSGESCTYMISVEESRHGELIQISDILEDNVSIEVFYGALTLENTS